MGGVEAEPVDVVLVHEQLAGVDEQVLHVLLLGGHPVAPGRRAAEVQAALGGSSLLGRVLEDRRPTWVEPVAGVVEHHVEEHGQPLLVGGSTRVRRSSGPPKSRSTAQ